MLFSKRLILILAFFLSVISFYSIPTQSHALIYRADFPNRSVVYFKTKDMGEHEHAQLNLTIFHDTLGILVTRAFPGEVLTQRDKILTISGGMTSSWDRPEESLYHNIRYVLEMLATAHKVRGFDKVLDNPTAFNRETERRLIVSIDANQPKDLMHTMSRSAAVADFLSQNDVIIRWQPHMHSLKRINQFSLSVIFPRTQNDHNTPNKHAVAVVRTFREAFKTRRVTFGSLLSPRFVDHDHLVQKTVHTPLSFTDNVAALLTQKHIADVYVNPFPTLNHWRDVNRFIINLTVEENDLSLTYLEEKLTALNNYLRKRNLTYALELLRVEHLTKPLKKASVTEDKSTNKTLAVLQLSNYIPDELTFPVGYPKEHTLSSTMVVEAMQGRNDKRLMVSRWNPTHLRVGLMPQIAKPLPYWECLFFYFKTLGDNKNKKHGYSRIA